MQVGIVRFPGSNCDADVLHLITNLLGHDGRYIWHQESSLDGVECVIIPGGFSFGDYLRCGAMAKASPVMKAVIGFAGGGGRVLGICNGFQILTEAGLLPGALLRNQSGRFCCKDVHIRVESTKGVLTKRCHSGQIVRIPIAHGEGRYYIDEAGYGEIEENQQILFRYCTGKGEITGESNPNGSMENIAGVCNREGNVCGLMPHPERCSEKILGNEDGLPFWISLLS